MAVLLSVKLPALLALLVITALGFAHGQCTVGSIQCSCPFTILSCSKKSIRALPPQLTTTKEIIDLSFNMISALGSKTFSQLTNLKSLKLDHNPLQNLPTGVFSLNTQLRKLDLSHTSIKTLPVGVFWNNGNIEELSFEGVHFTYLPRDIFAGLTWSKVRKLILRDHFWKFSVRCALLTVPNRLITLQATALAQLNIDRLCPAGTHPGCSYYWDPFNSFCKCNNGGQCKNKISIMRFHLGAIKSTIQSCIVIPPLNGMVDLETLVAYVNNVVTYSCNPGYRLIGAQQATCTAAGRLNVPLPRCAPTFVQNCPATSPPTSVFLPGGNLQRLSFAEGRTLCQKYGGDLTPYKPFGCIGRLMASAGYAPGWIWSIHPATVNTVYVFVTSGQFTSFYRFLKASIVCSSAALCNTATPINGAVTPYGVVNVNAVVTYSCLNGYRLLGAKQATCTATGQFKQRLPRCMATFRYYCTKYNAAVGGWQTATVFLPSSNLQRKVKFTEGRRQCQEGRGDLINGDFNSCIALFLSLLEFQPVGWIWTNQIRQANIASVIHYNGSTKALPFQGSAAVVCERERHMFVRG